MKRNLFFLSGALAIGLMLTSAAFAAAPAQTAAPATAPASRAAPVRQEADQPAPRAGRGGAATDAGWMRRHDSLVQRAKNGGIDLYFEGDSITDFWQTAGPRGGRNVWNKEFGGWKPGDFGISADLTQHVLWRLQNGELDGVKPKAFVLMIGTNNMPGRTYTVDQVVSGVKAIVDTLREKEPQAKILLLAIFPRNATANDPTRLKINQANELLAKFDDGKQVKFLNINDKFLGPDGSLSKDIFPDLLHPNEKGYQIWADAIKPTLTEWLGAPAATEPAK